MSAFLAIALVFSLSLAFPLKVSAVSTIDGLDHDSFSTAYYVDESSIYTYVTAFFNTTAEADIYLKMTVDAGQKVAAVITAPDDVYDDLEFYVYNGNGVLFLQDTGGITDNSSSITTHMVRFTATSSGTYYIVVNKAANTNTNSFFSLSFTKREATAIFESNFSPSTVSSSGNTSLSLDGVFSSTTSINLTNNSNIPNGAIVRSVTTTATQSPSQGNVTMYINPGNTNWIAAKVSSNSYGSFTIPSDLAAKQTWYFKYNQKALGASSMSNIKIKLDYKYDPTDSLFA
jgi:hypothetical protein